MEYYSVTKKNEILTFVATWMDLENIMFSEKIRERQYCISHTCGILKNTFI